MTTNWHILYCDGDGNICPVTDFIEACQPKHQVKILRFLSLLEEYGPTLPRPYADILQDGIHELRVKLSGNHARLLYFFCHQKFIILYDAFVKKTHRVPDKMIRNVANYRDEFMQQVPKARLEEIVYAEI